MKNCFPYCLLEIIVGEQNQQGGHKPGKYGKLREFEKLSESQGKLGKTQGNLNFLSKTWKTQGKCKVCGVISNKNLRNRFSLLSCSGKI